MDEKKVMFYIINEEGIREDAQVLAKYKLSNGKDYITYTFGEINDNNMIKIYCTGITEENHNYSYREIETNEEWTEVKDIMKELARSIDEPVPENIKCDLKLSGEEVSVRKPKKLLVSKKFADVLASKYSEETSKINALEDVNIETAVNTPADFILNEQVEDKEDILNKTIEIPTFEELQARNKRVESVINNVKSEPKVEPKEEVKFEMPTAIVPEVTPEAPVKPVPSADYKEKFKQEVEPLLLDVYAKQQQQIEALEEELSKTKFDLFEKQKEALSLKKEKEELSLNKTELETQLNGVQAKMNGILNVIQGNNTNSKPEELEEEKI